MLLASTLEHFFTTHAPLSPGDVLIAGFSAGPDSTALLLGLRQLAAIRGLGLHAAHLDHDLDPGSAGRAQAAQRLCRELQVPLVVERRPVAELRARGESLEAAARRIRYDFLEQVRLELGGRYVATAHHRDDQAETVLLRLLYGSGPEGLAGIRPVHRHVVRPLLLRRRAERELDEELRFPLLGLSREQLKAAVTQAGLEPVEDPTNLDPRQPRSLLRHHLLPYLAGQVPVPLAAQLARLACRAQGARQQLERRLLARLSVRPLVDGLAVPRQQLQELPPALLPAALSLLHRRARAPYPAGREARGELLRQLAGGGRLGCDCGGGWRWESRGELVVLCRRQAASVVFSYTLEVPGELAAPELPWRLRLRPGKWTEWLQARHDPAAGALDPGGLPELAPEGSQGPRRVRAFLDLPLCPGDRVTVRNRRPGDCVQPLGCRYHRRLKDVLIDRRVPRGQRDQLPLLCLGDGRIAWVAGVTINHQFRITDRAPLWVAEVELR